MMKLSFLSSFFFMLFIIPMILYKFVEADSRYEECEKPFLCGSSNINLSYPFYDGAVRPSYCGYPGFQVDCSKAMPEILMSSQTFYLLNMNATSGSTTVILQVYYDDGFCPQNLFLINPTLYDYASTNENFTIYYGCLTNTTITTNISQFYCRTASNETYQLAYYMIQNSDPSAAQNLNTSCQTSVVVPEQLQSGTQSNENKTRYGFGLQWIAENGLCDRCSGSGGKCGSYAPETKFACYCPNGSFDSDCNGKKSSKKRVVAGVLVGVAVLLAGCLFIIMRRKRPQAQTTVKDPGPVNLSTDLPSSSEFQFSQEAQDYTTNSSPSTNISQSMPSSYPSSKSDLDNISSYHGVKQFTYTELEEATDNFDESRRLGDGGFGVVYYGKLRDGRAVAVKRLYESSVKRMGQFMNEVTILAHLRHDNLVSLYGCTSKRSKDLIFVYEYIPNGTVADHLHGKLSVSNKLNWSIRLNIAVETAEALSYLHDNDVIHRDVKTTNILLDNNFRVKVADFGLSRLLPNDVTHVSTAPQGTPGYLDPYYYQCFRLTEKSDVYSFGVVLIELISSKMAVDVDRRNQDINLAIMAIDRIQKQAINELVDPNLGYNVDYDVQKTVKLMAELAFQCLQHERDMRPSMKEVLESLKGIQQEMVDAQKQVVVYIQESDDDVGLLRNAPPFSPETD